MKLINNFGILAAISWNSKKWADDPTELDLQYSLFGHVQKGGSLFESLTFGHEKFKCEKDGSYIGYTPTFQSRNPKEENSEDTKIMFLRSLNYRQKKMFIVGFYAFPEIGVFKRNAKDSMYEYYDWGNIKSKVENIVLLKNYIEIDNDIIFTNRFLPPYKKISQRGFNYLHSDNVMIILKKAILSNSEDIKLVKITGQLESILKK